MSTAIKRRTSIRDLIDNLDKYLQQRNYSAKTLRLHCRPLWNKLANYAEANGHEMVDDTWVSNFLTGYWESTGKSMSSNTRRKYCRAAEMLYEYQQKGRIVRYTGWKREVQNASNYQPLYDAVEKYSARNRLCEDTKTAYLNEINKLVVFLEKHEVGFDAINAGCIREYMLTLSYHKQSTIAYCHYILRVVLKYVYEASQTATDLSILCESIYVPQGRNIPSAYTPEEVESLLRAVDRSNAVGVRDYAILLVATRLGLRVSDIRTLTFDNIDWATNQIRLTQYKTGNDLTLPLPEDVGWAIIDYLKNARPKTESFYVFVRHIPPFEQFGTHNNFSCMIGKYFTKAGISVPRGKPHGMHSLRHSLASNMLAAGTPMPVVSEVLGHSDAKSTSVYLKIDVTQLRKCALDTDFGGGIL